MRLLNISITSLDLMGFFKKQFTQNKRWSTCNKFQSKGTCWVLLFIDRNTAACVDSFEIEYTPQEVLNKIKNKSIACFHRIYGCMEKLVRLYQFIFSKWLQNNI